MLKKKLNYCIEDILIKKKILKTFYEKFFVRNYMLDNSILFYKIKAKKTFLKFSPYLLNSFYSFVRVKSKTFTFFEFFKKKYVNLHQFLNHFYKTLKCLFLKKFKTLILLKSVRGGFCCYFSGFVGIVPLKHVLNFMHLKTTNFTKKFKLFVIHFFFNIKCLKKLLLFRFFFVSLKIKKRKKKLKFFRFKKKYLKLKKQKFRKKKFQLKKKYLKLKKKK